MYRVRLNVHIVMNTAVHISRTFRESCSLLSAGVVDKVLIIGMCGNGLPQHEQISDDIEIWRIPLWSANLPKGMLTLIPKFLERRARLMLGLLGRRISIVQAHSVNSLSDGVFVRTLWHTRLVYDCHELETRACHKPILGWVFEKIERRYIGRADSVIVVSDCIADWYERTYKMPRPRVVRNIPVRPASWPNESLAFRSEFDIPEEHLVFVYQGGLVRGRCIERYLRVFEQSSKDRHIVFMGYGSLAEKVQNSATRHPNIHFHPAVPQDCILQYTSSSDIALVLLDRAIQSYELSLPNKLFESIFAGVPVAIYDFPEMRKLLDKYRCGWIIGETDEDFAAFVNSVTRTEIALAGAGAREAREAFDWAHEAAILVDEYRRILGRPLEPSRLESSF